MALALQEAKKGQGKTSPNPAVGAVLVRGGRLLSIGFHRKAGSPHAEIEALRKVKIAKGATLYVTLEPCCHLEKRTPPCTEALIHAGIKRIIIGTLDPNPKVAGKGAKQLRAAGMEIKTGILENECRGLNTGYNFWIRKGRPWVTLKAAVSMDGKAAMPDGRSRWITSEPARRRGHQIRSQVDGILVGIGTVLQDDPRLNVRLGKNIGQPVRIVWDPDLRTPLHAKIISQKSAGPTWILTSPKNSASPRARRFQAGGVEIIPVSSASRKKIPAKKITGVLGRRGLQSLLVEGGPGMWTAFLREGVASELCLFIAPKILGSEAKSWVGPLGEKTVPPSPDWGLSGVERVGSDLLLRFKKN